MVEAEFTEQEIDFAMEMIRDLIPYDTPNYAQRLREMAIGCLQAENDPDLISLCEEHDRLLEKYGPDYFDPMKDTPKNTDESNWDDMSIMNVS